MNKKLRECHLKNDTPGIFIVLLFIFLNRHFYILITPGIGICGRTFNTVDIESVQFGISAGCYALCRRRVGQMEIVNKIIVVNLAEVSCTERFLFGIVEHIVDETAVALGYRI